MLEAFLKTSYDHSRAREEEAKIVEAMKQLPLEDLRKLASGELKMAWPGCGESDETMKFLQQFEGTPLMAQAIQLEEQGIQLEEQQNQQNQVRKQQRMMDDQDDVYDKKRAIETQKRLLVLQLVKSQMEGGQGGPPAPPGMMGTPPGAPPPAAEPPPPEAAPPAEPKMASSIEGNAMAEALQKMGFDMSSLKPLAQQVGGAAMNVAKANKGALLGAGVGAAGGAATGMMGENGGVGNALRNAAGGAVLGGMAGGAGQIGMRAQKAMAGNPGMGAGAAVQQAAQRQAAVTGRAARQGFNNAGAMSAAGDARIGAEHVQRFAKKQDAAAEAAWQAKQSPVAPPAAKKSYQSPGVVWSMTPEASASRLAVPPAELAGSLVNGAGG